MKNHDTRLDLTKNTKENGEEFLHSTEIRSHADISHISISLRLKDAIKATDKELLAYAQRITHNLSYPESSSSVLEQTNFRHWQFPLYFADDVLLRYTESEFKYLSPLQKHLEILRAEAEALLIHHKLNFCQLSDWEYIQNIRRALGILSMHIKDQTEELLTCPGFQNLHERQIDYDNIDQLINKLDMLKKELGPTVELIYAMLILSGIKSNSEFLYYAQKIDVLLTKLAKLPLVSTQLKHAQGTDSLDAQLTFLSVLRSQMTENFPIRQFDDNNFLFTHLLNQNWEKTKTISATQDIFAILDIIFLTYYGFNVYLVITEHNEYFLEVIFPSVSVWWPISNTPQMLFVSPPVRHIFDYRFLIAKMFVTIADIYIKIGREIDQALKMYRAAVRLYPEYISFLNRLVRTYITTGQPHLVLSQIKEMSELYPDSAEIHHLLGSTYCLLKDYDKAIDALEKAVSLKPDFIDAYNNLANCYYQNGNLIQAQKIYTRLLTLQPDYYEGVLGLGNVYFQLKQYGQALLYFERALKISHQHKGESQDKESQNLRALYNLAQTYYELGEIETSIKTYKELLRLNPDHPSAWYNLGIIYRNKGDVKQAIKCITRAIQINPNLMR